MGSNARLRQLAIPLSLATLLLLALVVRLAALDLPGHRGDVNVVARWAEHMVEYGPWDMLRHDGALYPALLYVYWLLGALLDGDALLRAVKGLSIPFDLVLGLVLYLVARRTVGGWRALVAPAIYLFNPAVLLAGPIWGQVDGAGTLVYLGALLAVAAGSYPAAGALAMLAGLIKPQFGLVAVPVAVLAVAEWRRAGRAAPILRAVLGAVGMYLVVAIPLRMDPVSFLGRFSEAAGSKPIASVNAPNLWGLLVGYKFPDGGLVWVGAVLLLLGLAAAQLPFRWRRDLATILAVGVFVAFAAYLLPTRVHERYLFPAMALLAPLAAGNWRVLVAYAILSVAFALSLIYVLVTTTRFSIPHDLEVLLSSRTAAVWLALTLIFVSATLVLLLVQRAPTTSDP